MPAQLAELQAEPAGALLRLAERRLDFRTFVRMTCVL